MLGARRPALVLGGLALALALTAYAGLAPATVEVAPPPPEVAAWEDVVSPDVPPREWTAIVVHHSASPTGSAARFHRWHLLKGWDGLGYHFVIGNGVGAADGQIEVGWRWLAQREGAHAGNQEFNDHGIGICLVGNYEQTAPTDAQLRALLALCRRLMLEYGIDTDRIVGHRDVKPTTLCPGKQFPLDRVRRELAER